MAWINTELSAWYLMSVIALGLGASCYDMLMIFCPVIADMRYQCVVLQNCHILGSVEEWQTSHTHTQSCRNIIYIRVGESNVAGRSYETFWKIQKSSKKFPKTLTEIWRKKKEKRKFPWSLYLIFISRSKTKKCTLGLVSAIYIGQRVLNDVLSSDAFRSSH